ncbi:MAG: type II toxin-antitoxin system VapC family toxin [Anaerolineae bacterium]|nr:type II toxin-antitoxin system VapC family toxin [Anaerolineae bacterium]
MKLLLDTHSFLWFISGSDKISQTARGLIEDDGNQPLLSMASLWEMAIKASIGRLELAHPFGELIPGQMSLNGIKTLEIRLEHVTRVSQLSFYHHDPFDRLLIAQAQVEAIPIVGADKAFDAYAITRMW